MRESLIILASAIFMLVWSMCLISIAADMVIIRKAVKKLESDRLYRNYDITSVTE